MTLQRTHTGEACEELQPMRRTHVVQVQGGLSPVGGTPHQSRRNEDSLVAHGEDLVGAAGPLQPMEDYDVDYTNGGLFCNSST